MHGDEHSLIRIEVAKHMSYSVRVRNWGETEEITRSCIYSSMQQVHLSLDSPQVTLHIENII